MEDKLETLRTLVFKVHPIEEEAWSVLSTLWTEVKFKRKQIITRPGKTEKYLYLVLEGVQRAYYQDDKRDATIVFSYAPSFSGIIDSFFLQQPSRYTLETITASSLLRIHYNDLSALIREHRSIESWVRMAITQTLSGTLQRQVELMSFSAVEKFTTLLNRSPQVLNLIPHRYLASYLGIDPATFSKLLSTVKL
jgi:CRP-like cAMP-binding protein